MNHELLKWLGILAWFWLGFRGFKRYYRTVPEFYDQFDPLELMFVMTLYSSFGPIIYIMSLIFKYLYKKNKNSTN
jgi:hypothetical protein